MPTSVVRTLVGPADRVYDRLGVAVLGLMYHDVVAGDASTSGFQGPGPDHFKVDPARFDAHLDAIAASGLTPRLVGERADEPGVLLTFDDGGSSAATRIAPALESRGWRGHFFVSTDLIGTKGFLDRDEILALHAAGHVVGSHACSHRALTSLDDAEVLREWSESRAVLGDLLRTRVAVASVPTGRYKSRVGRLAAEAGYEHLFTCEPWLEPRSLDSILVHGRYPVYAGTTPERIRAYCAFSRPTLWWVGGGWYVRKAAKTALGPVYESLRTRVLARASRAPAHT
jgi:peptidoglycan/xylan/chitin deacetylase (PgdA/CDA1 family)